MSDLSTLHTEMRVCRRCLEAGYQITPGAVFSGGREARVMVIGQAPGVTEVEAGRPFNAGSGRRLFDWLARAGWAEDDFRTRHYMTAVTKCFPGKSPNGRGDRVPTRAEQSLCRAFLERELAVIQPVLTIPVGGLAIRLFFPPKRRLDEVIGRALYLGTGDGSGGVFDWRQARQVANVERERIGSGRWLVPLPHPSGASAWPNRPRNQALIERALAILGEIRQYHDL